MSGFRSDHLIIRDYVTAADHVSILSLHRVLLYGFDLILYLTQLQYTTLPEGTVAITMTHSNIPTKHVDIRLTLHMTVS
jgi:hypothetical protein